MERSLEAGNASAWSFNDGVLKQDSMATDCRYILGAIFKEILWTDYDIRVTAKKIAGSEGFLVMFRVFPTGQVTIGSIWAAGEINMSQSKSRLRLLTVVM